MEIVINHSLLTDAPLTDGLAMQVMQITEEVTSFIEDLQKGNPSCYLMSGYRGAGKTSSIRYIEKEINGRKNDGSPESVFVYLNFSRAADPKFTRRNIIRALYNTLQALPSYKKNKKEEEGNNADEQFLHRLESVYQKTFWETTREAVDSSHTEKTLLTDFNIMKALQLVSYLLFATALASDSFRYSGWFIAIAAIIFIGLSLFSFFFSANKKYAAKTQSQQDFRRKTLYDDEIADHYLEEILVGLSMKYRIIFVFDELDKLKNDIIDKLFEEVKFLLVSGRASFVMVAGQELYYKYAFSSRQDDALLSSLFARHIHIPLMSREALFLFFDKLTNDVRLTLSQPEQEILNGFIDKLIFKSRRIPRKFINMIRQQLEWQNGKAILRIKDDPDAYKQYTAVLNSIAKVDNTMISSERYDRALQDYFVMQLFEKAQQILFDGRQQFHFNQILHRE